MFNQNDTEGEVLSRFFLDKTPSNLPKRQITRIVQLCIEEFFDDFSKLLNFDQPPRKKIKLVKAKKRLEFPCRQGCVLTPI